MRNGHAKKAEAVKEEPQSTANTNDLTYTVKQLYYVLF
jgi:hypothetical protein